jgi:hypothetical protein
MNSVEEYSQFVVMAEDAVITQNTTNMKWMGLESRRQTIQREMIYLENAIQISKKNPIHKEICYEHEKIIHSNLKIMKDVIVELRLDNMLKEQIKMITTMTHSYAIFHSFMEQDVYAHYCAGRPIEDLPLDVKKALHTKLKIALDELI